MTNHDLAFEYFDLEYTHRHRTLQNKKTALSKAAFPWR
jgi:hypothetical protein